MRHNLNIRVSDKPRNGGVVACRTVSIREKLFTLLLGPKQKVMVVVPGNQDDVVAFLPVHPREKLVLEPYALGIRVLVQPTREDVATYDRQVGRLQLR